MITLAGNLLCSIDVETTGLDESIHEIWEISIIPVNFNLEVDKTRPIFDLIMCPEDLDSDKLKLSKVNREYIEEHGVDHETGCDLFLKWFKKLGLKEQRRIVPLAHNWKFDSKFIQKWLGRDTYDLLIDGRHRDTLSLAIGINDAHELAGLGIPFPKLNLTFLCHILNIPLTRAHRALEDASATIELYRKLVRRVSERL